MELLYGKDKSELLKDVSTLLKSRGRKSTMTLTCVVALRALETKTTLEADLDRVLDTMSNNLTKWESMQPKEVLADVAPTFTEYFSKERWSADTRRLCVSFFFCNLREKRLTGRVHGDVTKSIEEALIFICNVEGMEPETYKEGK